MNSPALQFSLRFWMAAMAFSLVGWLLAAVSLSSSPQAETLGLWPLGLAAVWLVLALAAGRFLAPLWKEAPQESVFLRARLLKPLACFVTTTVALIAWLFWPQETTATFAAMLLCAGQGLGCWLDARLAPTLRRMALTRLPGSAPLCQLGLQLALHAGSFALLVLILVHPGRPTTAAALLPTADQQRAAAVLMVALAGLLGWLAGRECARAPARLARRLRRLGEQRDIERLDLDASQVTELGRAEATFNQLLAGWRENFERLRELTENIERTDRTRSRFLASFSHELRTPLNTIIGYADLFLSNMAGDLQPQAREYLQIIMQEGEKLLNIINQLLYLSRLDSGRDALKPVPVTAGWLQQRLQEMKEPALELHIENHLPPELELCLDEEKLLRALKVLYMLAVSGKSPGTALVELMAEEKALRVRCRLRMEHNDLIYSLPGALWLLGQALSRTVSGLHGGQSRTKANGGEMEVEIFLPGAVGPGCSG